MDFFEAAARRRSIRKYTDEAVPDEVIHKALDAALLAPNSSNTQTWDFYWVRNEEKREKLVKYCMSQAAARTARHLVVVVTDPKKWHRSYKPLNDFADSVNAPRIVKTYYRRLVPYVYTWGLFNCFAVVKWIVAETIALFRPILRGPYTRRDLQEMCMKSAGLAAENFVLAVSAQGYASCMMEGFDEPRVKRLLKLSRSSRIAMVLSVGVASERGTWSERFRIPKEQVIHII